MSRCTPSRLTSGPCAAFAAGDLVDLVDEDDAGLLDALDRGRATRCPCRSASALLPASGTRALRAPSSARFLRLALEQARQHVLQVDVDLLDRRAGDDLERRERLLAHVDFDDAVVEPAGAQLLAEPLARLAAAGSRAAAPDLRRARSAAAAAAAGRAAAPRRSAAAFARTSSSRSSRTMSTPSSTRSRTIDSTSRPT